MEDRQRAAWEVEACRRNPGLHRERDREFFELIWKQRFTSEDDEDLFDVAVKSGLDFYRLGQAKVGVTGGPGGHPGSGSSASEADIELGDIDLARARGFTEYISKTAGIDPLVMRFREKFSGGPMQTLDFEDALARLEAGSVPQGEEVTCEFTSLVWPDGGFGRHFRVPVDSDLGELSRLSGRLARRYPWDESQATSFVLCGGLPPVSVVRGGHRRTNRKGLSVHPYDQYKVTLEAAYWVPAEVIYKAYLKLQREANGSKKVRNGGTGAHRNIEVFRFALERATVSHVKRDEYLARLAVPSWPTLVEAWNKEQKGTRWEYRPGEYWKFPRDFNRGQEAIVGTSQGLLGEPGEPRTDEEKRRYLKEFSEQLPPPAATLTRLTATD